MVSRGADQGERKERKPKASGFQPRAMCQDRKIPWKMDGVPLYFRPLILCYSKKKMYSWLVLSNTQVEVVRYSWGQWVYVDFLESWCQHLRDWSRSQVPSCWSKAANADSTLYQFECDSCKTFPTCFAPLFAWAVVQILQNPQCRSICKGFSKHYQSVSNNLVQSISECLSRRLLYVFCMFCSVGFLISPLDFYKSIRIGPPLGFETFEWFENESQLDPRDVTKVTFNVENSTPPPTETHVCKGRNAKTYACCWGYLSERCPFSRPSALHRGAYNNQR